MYSSRLVLSETLILNLLFLAIVVLIALIGYLRGIKRELVFTIGILFGAEVALWWGGNWGEAISDRIDLSLGTSQFIGSMAAFFVTAVAIGYAGGAIIGSGEPSHIGHLLGALIGGLNGGLLIAFAIRLFNLSYQETRSNDPLSDSVFSRLLWEHFDWFILISSAALAGMFFLLRMLRRPVEVVPQVRTSKTIPPPPLHRTPPMSVDRELAVGAIAAQESNPVGVEGEVHFAAYFEQEWAESTRSANGQPEQFVTEQVKAMVAAEKPKENPLPSSRNPIRFCPNCGMTLDLSDKFCPDCGYTL